NILIPARRPQRLILTCTIGIVGALLGGWVAVKLFHIYRVQGFSILSTWLAAIAGAAVLLFAYHLVRLVVQPARLVRAPLAAATRRSGSRAAPWRRCGGLPAQGSCGDQLHESSYAGHHSVLLCQPAPTFPRVPPAPKRLPSR